ncbi:MAG: N-acetyltransferase [Desulfobacteraceae bacterium]|nr:MAG: N-acetyltransferase [Desulfobacteraceae bacterium]
MLITILRTKRLILRPLLFSDLNAMADTIMADKEVMHWLPYSHLCSTPEGQAYLAKGYLLDFIRPWKENGFGMWAVCIRDQALGAVGQFIGYCGFLPEKIAGAGPEIAYAMGKSMWGQGLIPEALDACLAWIFNHTAHTGVYAVTDTGNRASRKVMEKAGMRYKRGVDLYNSVAKGVGLLPFYAITREDYFENIPPEP